MPGRIAHMCKSFLILEVGNMGVDVMLALSSSAILLSNRWRTDLAVEECSMVYMRGLAMTSLFALKTHVDIEELKARPSNAE